MADTSGSSASSRSWRNSAGSTSLTLPSGWVCRSREQRACGTGIEVFPRQDRVAPGEFGNALRGPLGVHRANNHRYCFYDAGSDITSQLAYLKNLRNSPNLS